MQVMDRIALVCVVSVLAWMADVGAAKVPVRYSNRPETAETQRGEVVFETYDSFRSMLPSYSTRPLHKRQSEGPTEENPTVVNDDHTYYSSQFFPPGESADRLWFELSNIVGSGAFVENLDENTTEILGDTHRVYQVWNLKFQFPFYGHILDAVGVTSGGFLYTGTIYHDQVHLTQYIAPLMADFNPSLSSSGRVLVYTTEERFTVQWDQVINHDHPDDGPFTFQVSIFPSGKIYLAYRKLPLLWNQLNNDDHPVEVGIADALYFEVPGEFVILVEYSRVSADDLLPDNANIDLSYSAFEIDPVPNCVTADTCDSCMAITRLGVFNCSWCEAAQQKCSDGVDRFSQNWFDSGCFVNAVSTCPVPTVSPSETTTSTSSARLSDSRVSSRSVSSSPSMSTTLRPVAASTETPGPVVVSGSTALPTASLVGIVIGVAAFLVVVVVIVLVLIFAFYGIRHPTSSVGMFMIENRPKAWKLNKGASQSSKYEMHNKFENVYE